MYQQLVWDLNSDTVTPGQWLKGRVHTGRCDVSPDGRYLVLTATNYANQYRPQEHVLSHPHLANGWTAISRPPYFTALALWFTGDGYSGGGVWASNRTLDLAWGSTLTEAVRPNPSLTIRKLHSRRNEPLHVLRLIRNGWRVCHDRTSVLDGSKTERGLWERLLSLRSREGWQTEIEEAVQQQRDVIQAVLEKPIPRGLLRLERTAYAENWFLLDDSGEVHRAWRPPHLGTQFLEVDSSGRVIFSFQGCLWAWSEFPDGEPTLVADLNGNTFENVPPPDWAKAW